MKNPIIRGFNPDPAICRGPDGYYIATSTFEWYPGVQIHRSADLANWEHVTNPLSEARLLDMTGVPDSCGIWAPCLTYADGEFWLIYTVVRRFDGNFKDTPNYLTRAPSIFGPWSDPVYLNSSGFDPSLFHDVDGRKWLLNMVWDHRPDRSFFGGIMLQEYDATRECLIGEAKNIFPGTEHDGTEGPHLFRHDGYYFLICAEGGTGYEHAVTFVRSREIDGPYELDPKGLLITAKDAPNHPIQRSGHGGIVCTEDGRFFQSYLCSRPLMVPQGGPQKTSPSRRSPMGRETALQELWYRDGWFHTSPNPDQTHDPVPALNSGLDGNEEVHSLNKAYSFAPDGLPRDFQWLRNADTSELFSLADRPGWLRLYGRDAIGSTFYHSLVARRQTELVYNASVTLDFEPDDFQQWAGLVTYYNGHKFHYLYVSHDPELGRVADICSCHGDQSQQLDFPMWDERVVLPEGQIKLSVKVVGASQQFFVQAEGEEEQPIGPVLDASVLSDEAGKGEGANFTGNFVGMSAQDLTGHRKHADFRDFHYLCTPLDEVEK